MAKAVLVMDMPESCDRCRFKLNVPYNRNYCYINQNSCDKECRKPDWCPLRELPERETEMTDADDLGKDYVRGTMDGWNACLDEITGGNANEK